MKYEVALTESLHEQICSALLGHVRQGEMQEELRFALWRPGTGATRTSALVFEIVQPGPGDRQLHGNVSFDSGYLTRAVRVAMQKKAGLAFMHNHLTPGWQDMSAPDIVAERDRIASPAHATGLPLVGMTLGTDGSWSARTWTREEGGFKRQWCDKVRVAGSRLRVTFHDQGIPPPGRREILRRTIDTWGESCQQNLARLRIGVIGAGSVGSMVAEALARMGISNILLVDPDRVELHNLDRLLHASHQDVERYKAELVVEKLRDHATAERPDFNACILPAEREEAFREILDCDLLFSAVDRPLPKDLLNRIAYTHCIPVISGGVLVGNKQDGTLGQAAWSVTVAGPGHRCLRCDGQYTSSEVVMEKDGSLDDPTYIQGVREGGPGGREAHVNQNVFPFSANLASLMVLEMVRLVIAADWWPPSGGKLYYSMIPNRLESTREMCRENCSVYEGLALGDVYSYPFLLAREDQQDESAAGGHPGRFAKWFRALFPGGRHGKDN